MIQTLEEALQKRNQEINDIQKAKTELEQETVKHKIQQQIQIDDITAHNEALEAEKQEKVK